MFKNFTLAVKYYLHQLWVDGAPGGVRADLSGADLSDTIINDRTIGVHPAPEGELIAWGKKSGHIVGLLIPAKAPRSCATTRKHRSAWVKVLSIDDNEMGTLFHESSYGTTVYSVGKLTYSDSWDEDRWNECSHGIHWFLSRAEAEAWEE